MWKIFIWPAICLFFLRWNSSGYQYLVNHADQCDEIGCALAYMGFGMVNGIFIGSLIVYTVLVSGLFIYSKIKKKSVNFWLPLLFGPISATLALFLYVSIPDI